MKRVLITAAIGLSALTAGCGSSSSPSAATSASPSPAPAVTVTTTAPPTTPATTPTSTPPAAATTTAAATPSRCHTTDLKARLGGGDAGLSNRGLDIVLTNSSTTTCTIEGYPGIGLVLAGGSQSPVVVARGGTYFAMDPPETLINVTPGSSVVAAFGFNVAASGCPDPVSLAVIPPDETTSLSIPIAGMAKAGPVCSPEITRFKAGTTLTQ